MQKNIRKRLKKIISTAMTVAIATCSIFTGTITAGFQETPSHAMSAATHSAHHDIIPNGTEYVKGEAIVLYESSVTKKNAKRSLQKTSGDRTIEVTDMFDFGYGVDSTKNDTTNRSLAVTGRMNNSEKPLSASPFSVGVVKSTTLSTEELVDKLNQTPGVKRACPNYIFHVDGISDSVSTGSKAATAAVSGSTNSCSDPASATMSAKDAGQSSRSETKSLKDFQWALHNDGRDGGKEGADIKRESVSIKDKSEKVVAVVDSGIDYTHDDLKDIMWNNPFEDDVLKGTCGFDFVNGDDDPIDDYNHGTHCAGIIAGTGGNGHGIEGIAKDTGTKLMALKVLDSTGMGSFSNIIASYNYIYKAATLGVNIVAANNSLGGMVDQNSLYIHKCIFDSLGQIGILNVCSAGNESLDLNGIYYAPVCAESDYVVGVAASEADDGLASYSNYGLGQIDIAAPGTSILSTVALPQYIPWCYTDEKYHDVVDFDATFDNADSIDSIDLSNPKRMKAEWVDGEEAGASDKESGCLKVKVNAAEGANYYIYLNRYETKQSDSPIFASVDIRIEGARAGAMGQLVDGMQTPDGGLDTDDCKIIARDSSKPENKLWGKLAGTVCDSQNADEERVMTLSLDIQQAGEYTLYLDNVTMSKPNIPIETFDKYAYFKGTSMSCPYAAGAVALLAAGYPDDSPLARKNRLLSCVRKSDDLEGMVNTGGTLDLTNCDNPTPMLTDARINDDGTVTINGFALADMKLLIDGEEAVIRTKSDEQITIEANEYENRTVRISIEKDGETQDEQMIHLGAGDEFDIEPSIPGLDFQGDKLMYNEKDKRIYFTKNNYDIYAGTLDHMEQIYTHTGSVNLTGMGESLSEWTECTFLWGDTDPTLVDGTIYTVVCVDSAYETYKILIRFDMSDYCWKYVCNLPDAFKNTIGMTLTGYNGGLYILGGLDTEKNEPINNVCRYDLESEQLTEVAPLPEKRAFAEAAVCGGKLYVSLGGGESSGIILLIYDGVSWTKSSAMIDDNKLVSNYFSSADSSFSYHSGYIHPVKNGIVFFTSGTDGMSLPFMYNVSTDTFENMKWHFDPMKYTFYNTVVIENKLYVICDMAGIFWSRGATVYSIPVEGENSFETETPSPIATPAPASAPTASLAPESGTVSSPPASSPNQTNRTLAEKPARVKIKKATLKNKKLSVTFSEVKSAKGYVVQAASDKKFTKHIKKWQIKKPYIKNKKWTKKTCYVRVRAYVKKGGAYTYGNWSHVCALPTKK